MSDEFEQKVRQALHKEIHEKKKLVEEKLRERRKYQEKIKKQVQEQFSHVNKYSERVSIAYRKYIAARQAMYDSRKELKKELNKLVHEAKSVLRKIPSEELRKSLKAKIEQWEHQLKRI